MNTTGANTLLAGVLLLGVCRAALAVGILAPEIRSDVWLNSKPLTGEDLKGKVVLVEFWTFGCWNCKHVEPFVKNWHARYAKKGLVIIAVHAPEFGHERELANVKRYVRENGIQYAVPVDNDFAIWRAFGNRAWPAMYLIDKNGRIQYEHIGEGQYEQTEEKIRELIASPG